MTENATPPLSFGSVYDDAFVRRSHELISIGHKRLVTSDLVALEETDITGKLCDAMNAALDAENAPAWATVLTVVDDQPESVRKKTGKRRPRTDVCVRCINPRPEHRFRFEAKRLNAKAALAIYLGDTGMLALIQNYYGELRYAGMIGYVQVDTPAEWSARIRKAITDNPGKYHAVEPVAFTALGMGVPEPIFASHHMVPGSESDKRITHTLLLCA